jgi:hypothetical protein
MMFVQTNTDSLNIQYQYTSKSEDLIDIYLVEYLDHSK